MKSIFAAAALLIATGASPDVAEAKHRTRVHIGISIGDPFWDRYCDSFWFNDECRYRRFGHFYGPSRFFYARPRTVYRVVDRMSCTQARLTLREHGYRNVRARDCKGRFYSFNATRKGRPYRVTVNAVSGHISRSRF